MARQNTGASAAAAKPTKQKKSRWYHQVWQAYQMTRKQDPRVTLYMLAAFFGVLIIAVGIGYAWGSSTGDTGARIAYTLTLGVPFGLLAAMFLLARRAETAAYSQIEGQPGSSRAALGTIRRGWTFAEEPIAVDPRTQDLVFRGVGRAGIVLVSEGPGPRAAKLLDAERKRTNRVLPNVPVTLIQSGDGAGQVALRKLPRTVQRLKPTLTKGEVTEISKRLTALGTMRLPVPKGIDPLRARPDRKGMRGR